MWILGLKGIIDMQTLVVEGFCLSEGRIIFSVVVPTFSFYSEQSFYVT